MLLQDTLKALNNFKNKQQKCTGNVLCYVKLCIFWKYIQYTINWDKTQISKKIPRGKINGTKNAPFFLSWAPTHYSFTFNLWFLYEMKHKVRLSETVCGIFHFRFCSIFIKLKFIFLFNKMQGHFEFKTS